MRPSIAVPGWDRSAEQETGEDLMRILHCTATVSAQTNSHAMADIFSNRMALEAAYSLGEKKKCY